MSGTARDFLHTSRAVVTVPLGFFAGGGIAFFSCLLWEEQLWGHFESRLALSALSVAFWAGILCGAIVFLLEAIFFWVWHLRNK
jgi:hypothetical protein